MLATFNLGRTIMLRTCLTLLLAVTLAAPALAYRQAAAEDRIYGTVTTSDGDTFEGFIRWDKNEAAWVDLLDGSKRIMHQDAHDHRRQRQIEVFGIKFNYDSSNEGTTRTSGIRFGHLRSLENVGSNTALLTLRTGEEVEFRGGSTDIGSDIRSIIIEDTRRGSITLRWRDLERIDFRSVPRGLSSADGSRLYGTLKTRRGDSFTGYICWDVDEVLGVDILDGTDQQDRKRKIPFADISSIARQSQRATRVTLTSGEEVVLRGSNDVDSDNRGILILDHNLGQVRIDWGDFGELIFRTPPKAVSYADFGRGGPLYGTVYLRDGGKVTGRIIWDDDEQAGWELLNGDVGDVEYQIEFNLIATIERLSSQSARVTLRDGRSFDLRGSNDVNDDNDGIIVINEGEETVLAWRDFERVVFDK